VIRKDWGPITRFYRDLFARFSVRNQGPAATLRYLRRQQGAEIIRSLWRNKFPPHGLPMLAELLVEDPCLPFWCGWRLAAGLLGRLALEKSFPGLGHRRENPL